MPDEDKAALALAEAKIKELEDALAAMRVELEKQKGIVTNAESKFSEMGEETGENRKAIAEAARGLVKANADAAKTQDSLRELNDQLTEARKKGPEQKPPEESEDEKKTPDEIQSTFSDAEKSKLAEVLKGADNDMLDTLDNDETERKRLLLRVKTEVKTNPDRSAWRKKPEEKSPSGDEDRLDKLFKTKIRSERFTPAGPGGGTPRERNKPGPGAKSGKDADWMGG